MVSLARQICPDCDGMGNVSVANTHTVGCGACGGSILRSGRGFVMEDSIEGKLDQIIAILKEGTHG